MLYIDLIKIHLWDGDMIRYPTWNFFGLQRHIKHANLGSANYFIMQKRKKEKKGGMEIDKRGFRKKKRGMGGPTSMKWRKSDPKGRRDSGD